VHLRLPGPSGPHAVGREHLVLADDRPEVNTPGAADRRRVPVTVWFPAEPGTGRRAPYVPGLDRIGDGLVASGELGRAQVTGLRYVRANARTGARVAAGTFPAVLLSPGHATNAGFYAALAEDLAGRGYVVVGVDHPYQVAAVELGDGTVAVLAPERAGADPGMTVAGRIAERVADLRLVMDRLDRVDTLVGGRIDHTRVGVMGHSNGGIAAAGACRADRRLRACLNLDGVAPGGPFSATPGTGAPAQPFMFLTKETTQPPAVTAQFEAAGRRARQKSVAAAGFEAAGDGAYQVIVPAAGHGQFADGPLLEPGLLPSGRTADRVIAVTRGFTAAFFDLALRGAPRSVLGDVDAPTDVQVRVYPLTRTG
jgi:dienelactone hydrolase